MCDEYTVKDANRYLSRNGMTRRGFHAVSAAAATAVLLPSSANALSVVEQEVSVGTPDGQADCYFVHPQEGTHAAAIIWPDVMGIRPAFRSMGKRLAESGYAVLVVNPYYRSAKGRVLPEGKTFRDPGVRELLMPHARRLSPVTCVTDGRAFVTYLDEQPSVDVGRKVGSTGYCMTGSYPLRLAAAIPERIGAGASFHGGQLVTDDENSPHRLVSKTRAGFLIAIAESDDRRNPDEKVELRKAFDQANVSAEIEVYPGTQHGWCPPDSAVYDEAQADRAWARLLALFERELS